MAGNWPSARVAFHHRTGSLALGEASVAIAAASPHRAEAFAACRYVIERLKQIAPVWKHEFFEAATCWVEGATADPSTTRHARRRTAAHARNRARLFGRLHDLAGLRELERELPRDGDGGGGLAGG